MSRPDTRIRAKLIRPYQDHSAEAYSARMSRPDTRIRAKLIRPYQRHSAEVHSARMSRPITRIRPKLIRQGPLGLGQSSFSQWYSAEGHSAKLIRPKSLGHFHSYSAMPTRPSRSAKVKFTRQTFTRPHNSDSACHSDISLGQGQVHSAAPSLGRTIRARPSSLGQDDSDSAAHSAMTLGFGQVHSAEVHSARMIRTAHSDSQSDSAIVLGLGMAVGLGHSTRTRPSHSDASYSSLSPS